jgi:hypothetical protein
MKLSTNMKSSYVTEPFYLLKSFDVSFHSVVAVRTSEVKATPALHDVDSEIFDS